MRLPALVLAVSAGALLLSLTPLASADPPGVSVGSHPDDPTSSAAAPFSFASPDPDATFACRLDGGDYTPCASPTNVTVGEGVHTFDVQATSLAGETSVASFTWTVDLTPPDVPGITGGPTGSTVDTTPAFSFSGTGVTSYRCSVDESPPTASCTSPFSAAPLAEGPHTFYVAAADAVGNTSAAASRTFTVDTTPPETSITTTIPGVVASREVSVAFEASEAGATFSCSLDGTAFAGCASPASLTALADGTHTFSARATDAAGNQDATPAEISWLVDTTPPLLSPVGQLDKTVEADGPAGTRVQFAVSASDDGAPLLPSAIACLPASGTVFPLGRTTVTCRAQDPVGNIGVLTFRISVVDTNPPSINAPDVSFTATDAAGIASTAPAVRSYLAAISASDLISTPTVVVSPPAVFPIGTSTLVVTARDAAQNVATKRVTVTVLPPGTPAPALDLTAPAAVTGAKAKAGDRSVSLTWRRPRRDVARVDIRRSTVGEADTSRLVYSGLAEAFTSKGLQNGSTYRFVFVVYDAAGNSSASVIVNATPRAEQLASPPLGGHVSSPPLLRWAPVPATYFNVQLYYHGSKVLSAWPTYARLQLQAHWKFAKKTYRLRPGVYTWYVWPGLGARADVRYGALLGKSSFVVMPGAV